MAKFGLLFSRGPWIFKVPVCFQRLESHNFNQSCTERCVKRFRCCNCPSKAVECAEPPTSPLLVFGSGAQKLTLVNDLYLQSTPAVFKITYKSHWNPTPSLCVAHALQQLSFLPGFLEMLNFFPPSPPCLSFSCGNAGTGFQCRWGRYCLYWGQCVTLGGWERGERLVRSAFSPNSCVSSSKIQREA